MNKFVSLLIAYALGALSMAAVMIFLFSTNAVGEPLEEFYFSEDAGLITISGTLASSTQFGDFKIGQPAVLNQNYPNDDGTAWLVFTDDRGHSAYVEKSPGPSKYAFTQHFYGGSTRFRAVRIPFH
jgi:hypothetical protein